MSHQLRQAFLSSKWLLWATVGSNLTDTDIFYFTVRSGMPVLRIEPNEVTEEITGRELWLFLK